MTEQNYTAIPRFNDHTNCKGHANWMLDCEFTKKDDREILVSALDRHIKSVELDIEKENV